MADQQNEKFPYKSRFAISLWLTPVQYLAENMVARLATRDKVQLPDYFWKEPAWEKEFIRQSAAAASLLKEYSIEAIIAALRTTRGKQLYSLGAKAQLVPLIKLQQKRLNQKQVLADMQDEQQPTETVEVAATEAPRPKFIEKPNATSKLKGL